MKRGKPLQRKSPLTAKTPMKRGKGLERTPMKAGSGPTPRKAVAQRSAKRKAQMPERIALYERVRTEHGHQCAWPKCTATWVDLHEILTRGRGGDITDRRIIIGLCRHHNELATDTAAAECMGVVVPSWTASNIEGAMAQAEMLRLRHNLSDPPPCPWRKVGQLCSSPDPLQATRCAAAT